MVIELFEKMGSVLKSLHGDEMDVSYTETVVRGGWTYEELPDVPQLQGVACKANLLLDDPIEGRTLESSVREIQVFCDPDLNIPAGSSVVIRRKNSAGAVVATYEGTSSVTNEPNKYHGHQTFVVQLSKPV